MRIFVYEHITGGGLAGNALPPGLTREADLMVRALLQDLAEVPGVSVVASRDPRLPPLPGVEPLTALPGEAYPALYARGLAGTDAAWPTAPETGGVLERLSALTLKLDRILIGCEPDAVRLTGSKCATTSRLREWGIPAAVSFTRPETVTAREGPWVLKPDDGAGCEDTVWVPDWRAARDRLAREPGRYIAEPWLEGDSMSLSFLARKGEAVLLACNRQLVGIVEGRLTLTGLQVNAIPDPAGAYAELAGRIAECVPSLRGYVGVDLVAGPEGPVVVEINPRLTTSYCGLRRALGLNVAAMVLSLLDGDPCPIPPRPGGRSMVELLLESSGG